MKKSHAGLWLGVGVFFAAAVYSVILFLVKPSFDLSAWVLYGSTMIAFLLLGIQLVASSGSGSGLIFDTAFGIVTLIYFLIQFIFGGIICMRQNDLPLTPVVVCEIILLAAYLVIMFLMNAAHSHSSAQDQNDRTAVQTARLREAQIRGFADKASLPALKKALNDLADDVHYSSPATRPGLADVESRIDKQIIILEDELSNNSGDPLERVQKIRDLLKERERTAAILK